jgi:hypothetical protein
MSPTTCHPQHVVHNMSPTTCLPQHVAHNMSPTTDSASDSDSTLQLACELGHSSENGCDDLTAKVKLSCTVKSVSPALQRLLRGRRGMHRVDESIHHDVWDGVLDEGCPISLRELVSLAVNHLGLEDNELTHKQLLLCSWTLGFHVHAVDSNGDSTHFWGGGMTANTTSSLKRGDWVEIEGSELLWDVRTSRLARMYCGVRIKNIKRVFGTALSDDVWENRWCEQNDCIVFLLIRYVMPHQATRMRGPEHRPLCPGHLKDTHCLWKWCQREASYRRGCLRPRPWSRNKKFFGKTDEQQTRRKEQEARAWFDLVQSRNVGCHTNVKEDWDRPDSFLQSVMWC